MTATLTPTEDQVFGQVWDLIVSYFGASVQQAIFKGFQNLIPTPSGSYVVISPGVNVRQNQLERGYDPVSGLQILTRRTTYSYQVDCYGPNGPDWANTIAIAWASLWSIDNGDTPPLITPLYADEPQQLNIVNGELQWEQRFMCKLYGQVNHRVSLPQSFFTDPPAIGLVVADNLPVV